MARRETIAAFAARHGWTLSEFRRMARAGGVTPSVLRDDIREIEARKRSARAVKGWETRRRKQSERLAREKAARERRTVAASKAQATREKNRRAALTPAERRAEDAARRRERDAMVRAMFTSRSEKRMSRGWSPVSPHSPRTYAELLRVNEAWSKKHSHVKLSRFDPELARRDAAYALAYANVYVYSYDEGEAWDAAYLDFLARWGARLEEVEDQRVKSTPRV